MFVGCTNDPVVDNSESCKVCHSDQNMADVQFQFAQSAHSAGEAAVEYAGGRASCSQCHSSEGFLAFAGGQEAQDIASPSPWECKTCHGLHKTFEVEDYALRLDEPVALICDETVLVDLGNSNLCVNCHQSRRAEPNVDVPGETFNISSTHYGPHHGAQANVVWGAGFAELEGSLSYPNPGTTLHSTLGCTGCHMGEYSDGTGGHTYNPTLNACVTCHSEADDFDVHGGQTEVEELLVELRDVLVAQGVVEYVEADEAYEPVVGEHSMVQAQAFFNWIGLEEDRSLGAHNPNYVKALLKNTIDALN